MGLGKDITVTFKNFGLLVIHLFFMMNLQLLAAVPTVERNVLIALYNVTHGDSWTDNSGWKSPPLDADGFAMPGSESAWKGITIATDHVTQINLGSNNLSGSIPAELGSLSALSKLDLGGNRLTGYIPAQLGNIGNLLTLSLANNQLSGGIPSQLGNLSNLSTLNLARNKLSGTIPANLGNLSSLIYLGMNSNCLFGSVPQDLMKLDKPTYIHDFRWNALYTNNPTIESFMSEKQFVGDWKLTQTVTPSGIYSSDPTETTITIHWNAIDYTGDTGGYRISYATSAGGPFSFYEMTENKSTISMVVTGLTHSTTYYFVVETQTNSHDNNPLNTIVSYKSGVIQGTTTVGLPVELSALSAVYNDGNVIINWTTETEINNLGFILEGRDCNQNWSKIASYATHTELLGQGTIFHPTRYSYTDSRSGIGDRQSYRISDVSTDGQVCILDSVTLANVKVPDKIELKAPYPNPFNPSTEITYILSEYNGPVELLVFTISGRQVATLVRQNQSDGIYKARWNGCDNVGNISASGMYLIVLKADKNTLVRKVLLMR